MNVFNHDLESVETSGFCHLNLPNESLSQILIHDPIWGSEEGQDIRDEVFLVLRQTIPMLKIFREIHFFDRPNGSYCLFVHLPNLGIFNGEDDESTGILSQEGFVIWVEVIVIFDGISRGILDSCWLQVRQLSSFLCFQVYEGTTWNDDISSKALHQIELTLTSTSGLATSPLTRSRVFLTKDMLFSISRWDQVNCNQNTSRNNCWLRDWNEDYERRRERVKIL